MHPEEAGKSAGRTYEFTFTFLLLPAVQTPIISTLRNETGSRMGNPAAAKERDTTWSAQGTGLFEKRVKFTRARSSG